MENLNNLHDFTAAEIAQLPVGAETDALVAVNVMGMTRSVSELGTVTFFDGTDTWIDEAPAYSTSPDASKALRDEIVGRLVKYEGSVKILDTGVYSQCNIEDNGQVFHAIAGGASRVEHALAICALLWKKAELEAGT